MTTVPTEIWLGSYCFRVDHSAPKYGRETRRVYRPVGFERFASFSYDPDITGADPERPWGSIAGKCKTGTCAAEVTIKCLEQDIVKARALVAAADWHSSHQSKTEAKS